MSDCTTTLAIPAPRLGPAARWARGLLLRRLAGLRGGALRLADGEGVHVAGAGRPAATIEVRDPTFYTEALLGGSVAAGATYAAGMWTCDDLPALVGLLAANRDLVDRHDGGWPALAAPARRLLHWLHRNTRAGARANIAAHYDLGNAMFALWLDPTMSYSACWFARGDESLEEAAVAKLERVCQRLELRPGMHLVEIGSGWGGLALHAARHHGVRVTTTTISAAQAAEARRRVAAAGLDRQVTVLELDYRDLPARLAGDPADRLVSIEMVEAIGHRQYPLYFRTIAGLLAPGGRALVQAITIPAGRYAAALREVDFIKRYIFPGSEIPSLPALAGAAGETGLEVVAAEDFAAGYARTLQLWRERFLAAAPTLDVLGHDARFRRLWEFYLAYCEGGFRARAIGVAHLVLEPRA
jgi:cyclopropane-fatty-acyl-phospholipid synthase